MDGINRLIAVTQLKASNANEEAMTGANKLGNVIEQQRHVRPAATYADALVTSASESNHYITSLLQQVFGRLLTNFDSQAKLGSFEIQDLMSQYNQADTLANSVRKKQDDTTSSIIGKI